MKKHVLLCIITLPTSHALCMHLSEKQKTKEIIAFESTVNQLFKQVYEEAHNDPSIRPHNLIFKLNDTTLANLKKSAGVKKSLQRFGTALLNDPASFFAYEEILVSKHKSCEERQKLWSNFHNASRKFLVKKLMNDLPSLRIQNPITLINILRGSRNLWVAEHNIFFGGFLTIIATINLHLLHDLESYPRRDNRLQCMVQSFNKIDLAPTHT